jgi:hypothetical protein
MNVPQMAAVGNNTNVQQVTAGNPNLCKNNGSVTKL